MEVNVYCDLNFAKGAYIDLEYVGGGGENDYSWIRMNIEDGSIHTTYNCIRYLKHTLQEWYKDNRKYLEDKLFILGDLFDRSDYNLNPVDLDCKVMELGENCFIIRGKHN